MFKRNPLIIIMLVILFLSFIIEGCSRNYVPNREDITGNLVITNSSSQGIKRVTLLSEQEEDVFIEDGATEYADGSLLLTNHFFCYDIVERNSYTFKFALTTDKGEIIESSKFTKDFTSNKNDVFDLYIVEDKDGKLSIVE